MIIFYTIIFLFAALFYTRSFELIELPVDFGITPLLGTQYRLSRVHSAGDDYQTYNRVILFSTYGDQGNAKFVEGFGADEFIVEGNTSTYSFRKKTALPIELYEFSRFRVIGDYRGTGPQIRSWLSLTIVAFGLDIGYEHSIFNCRLRDVDATYGQALEAYNSNSYGTNSNIEFHDRDVRTVITQRNLLAERRLITPTPPVEGITEKILETA